MIIGVPREIKPGEQRVALTPAGVRALLEARQQVLVERGAGQGSSIRDEEYVREGASLVDVDEVWARAEMVLKVKEPLPEEYGRMRAAQILFTYLHLAAAPELARALQAADVIAIAYETVQRADGSLPLLAPMSEVAGRLAVQEGAFYLAKAHGGRGILLAGVPGVPPGNVVVVGAGVGGRERGAHRARPGRGRLDPRRQPRSPARGRRPLPRPGHHADVQQLQPRPGAPARGSPGGRGAHRRARGRRCW